jgi:hypothetical protein
VSYYRKAVCLSAVYKCSATCTTYVLLELLSHITVEYVTNLKEPSVYLNESLDGQDLKKIAWTFIYVCRVEKNFKWKLPCKIFVFGRAFCVVFLNKILTLALG